ncbi:MAG: VCBS repeat-containing protein [Nitrospinae bacterium]|nr:VCBS repeat-containing protein [Nitrospinota bacterium]
MSTQLVGLGCNTTYHYRAVATNAVSTDYGSDRTFKTAPCSAPSVATIGATGVSQTGATLKGAVDPKKAATTVTFQYTDHATYTVDTYGYTASAGIINGTARAVSAVLTGLSPCTMYHFRVTAENANNVGTPTEGVDRTFTTLCADSGAAAKPVASDFGGDGKSDILLRDSATGQTAAWMMNGATVTSNLATSMNAGAYTSTSGWQAQGIGDFDGDRRSDVLWRDAATGQLAVWTMNGATATGAMVSANPGAYTSSAGWQVQGLGDFNADGKSDILFRHAVSGEMSVWFMNGAVKTGGGRIGSTLGAYTATTGWQVHSVGDFNGDGKSDILWRHAGTGQTAIWFMDGVTKVGGGNTTTQAGAYTSTTGWQVQGSGDFNGDGKSDILLRNAETGRMATWMMNGRTVVSSGYTSVDAGPYTASSGLQVSAIGDYNGDGKSDILLRDASTGQTLVWTMSGSQVTASSATDVSPGAYTSETGWNVISEESVR